jgi:hypothetical protein
MMPERQESHAQDKDDLGIQLIVKPSQNAII